MGLSPCAQHPPCSVPPSCCWGPTPGRCGAAAAAGAAPGWDGKGKIGHFWCVTATAAPGAFVCGTGTRGGTSTSPAALPVPALQLRPRCQGVHGHPWDVPRREEGGGRWLWAGDGAGRGVTLPGGCFRGHHHGEISTWEVLDVSCGCWRVNNPTRPLVLLLGCFQPWQSFGMDALPVPGEQPGASPFLVEVKNSWGGL